MTGYAAQATWLAGLLERTPGWPRVLELDGGIDAETTRAILDEAARFAENVLAPLDRRADEEGCSLSGGRVVTPEGYASAHRAFADGGWIGIDLPEEFGGQSLPHALQAACETLFDRACVAFMMAPGASRAAGQLLSSVASEELAEAWVPHLVSGRWSATICISEPGAGSDVGRISSRARNDDGTWRIDGEKCWISFGDHDLADRIGHLLIARTSDTPGTRGLSLFLVPDTRDDGDRNGIAVDRIEEKLGLHGSPTCVLRFEGAEGTLIGDEGKGLSQLFAMIEFMRLQTGCQGVAHAMAALDIARDYAAERRQGGPADAPPVPIIEHPDVRRQILAMEGRVEPLAAAVLELAVTMDLARREPEESRDHAHLAAWMLPLIKTFGGETGFNTASAAIQVLGGAGYTREWPVEQTLRDARILTIYEGTTGIQAQDFLLRRHLRGEGHGLARFLTLARAEIARVGEADTAATLGALLDRFEAVSAALKEADPERAAWCADAYLRAAWIAVTGWMVARKVAADGAAPDWARWRLATLPQELETCIAEIEAV